ncbi:MAG: SDR family oxidoreductase [Deltaproteobacteria bacterium]
MTTLITGATGFLGSHIARKLAARGEKVKILLRASSKTSNIDDIPGIERVYGDITDIESVKRAIAGCDTVYHTAGFVSFKKSDYQKMQDINVGGTINVLSAALDAGVKKAVHTSSVAAVGAEASGAVATEETKFTLEGEGIGYLNTKHYSERAAIKIHEQGLPLVVVNPSVVIGPGDVYLSSTGALLWYCKKKFPGYMDGTLNLVDVEDVAEGHILAAEKGNIGERYILANRNLTVREFFDLMEKITGIPAPKMKIPYFFAYGSAFVVERILGLSFPNFSTMDVDSVKLSKFCWHVDASKALRELGFRQSPIEQSIEKTVKWFKDNGHL